MKFNFLDIIYVPYKTDKRNTIIILISFIFISIAPIFLLIGITGFIDHVLLYFDGASKLIDVLLYLLIMIACMITKNISRYFFNKYNKILECKLEQSLTIEYASINSNLKYEYIENTKVLDLIKRVDRLSIKNWGTNFKSFLELISIFIQVLFILVVVLSINLFLAILLMSITIFYIYRSLKSGSKEYENIKEVTMYQRKAEYFENILTSRENAKEHKIFNYGSFMLSHYDNNSNQYLSKRNKIAVKRQSQFSMINLFSGLFIGVVMLFLLPDIYSGSLSIGLFISLINEINLLMDIIAWNVSRQILNLAKFKHYLKDVESLFNLVSKEKEKKQTIHHIDKIEFNNVSFCYPGSTHKILDEFSLVLYNNKSYGLVGINGSGKTTITKLLLGLYDSYEGEILINDINIKNISNLFELFSVVFQDFVKYELSVREFLQLGDTTINHEILKKVNMYDYIMNLPNQYDTKLGKLFDDGVDLSGGQWQRLVISRTLSKDSHLYILDEPSSALDPLIELEMYEMFYEILNHKFSIFITHRLGITKLLDEIIVIDGGKVVEKGHHNELLLNNDLYASMYNKQKEWYDEKIF